METDNYFYTDKKGKRFLEVFKNHLDFSETPQIGLLAHQNMRFFRILLTDKQLWIAKYPVLGRPSKFQSFHYNDMKSSLLTTGKTKSITFNWQDDSTFTAEIDAKDLSQARQIASTFPSFEEKHIQRSLAEKVEIFGWVLFGATALIAILLAELLHISPESIMDYVMLFAALSFSILGAAIVVRRENIRGHTGWNAVLFGLMTFLLGIFLLTGAIAKIFFGI
jgi:hypothetical protein